MLSASIEDYIKAIYALEVEDHKATTKKIAQRLGVKMASVTGMLKHLSAEGYVGHTPYRGVQLTENGRRIALDMIRRHRLIELFLSTTLGLTWDEVDADAEVLEHAMSDRLIERIYEHLGCPEFDPHGAPIPSKDGSIAPRRGVPLDQLKEGDRARVVEVCDRDPEFLRYLTKLKLKIGSEIRVRERAPFSGPIMLELDSGTVAIGPEACSRIRVSVEKRPKTRQRTKRG
ncbi:MAG: metal-dependent transcriptional regulator [Phycisphaerales bacterium]|nr:MAG: metal-dependent transcriptional regulator [Phycisphaerales bacterium]